MSGNTNNNYIFQNSGNIEINTGLDGRQSSEAQQLALIYATERVGFMEKLGGLLPFNSELILEFVGMGGNSGSQSSRLQIDATADGSLHVIGASDGVGEYTMTFLDGPFLNPNGTSLMGRAGKAIKKTLTNDTSSVLSFYKKRKNNILGREVTIYIFNRNQGEKGIIGGAENLSANRWTTFAGISFNGIIQKVEIGLKQVEGGAYCVQVGLGLIGGWRE